MPGGVGGEEPRGSPLSRSPTRITHRIHESIVLHQRESPAFPGQTSLRETDQRHQYVSDHATNAPPTTKGAGERALKRPHHPARQAPTKATARADMALGPAPQTANADGNGALCSPSPNRRRPRRK